MPYKKTDGQLRIIHSRFRLVKSDYRLIWVHCAMDTRLKYQRLIKSVLQNHADYRATLPDGYTSQIVFDDERGQYLILDMGWNGG